MNLAHFGEAFSCGFILHSIHGFSVHVPHDKLQQSCFRVVDSFALLAAVGIISYLHHYTQTEHLYAMWDDIIIEMTWLKLKPCT